jgi:glycosyltransferase involved in cell wall biosynthesis
VPVITTKGAPWRRLEKHRCGWWIDIGKKPLVEALKEAMSLSSERLFEMGAGGRKWMQRDFSWERIGRMMYQTYEWVLGAGPPPGWVATD